MSYYSEIPLNDSSMSAEAGEKCIGYGAGASHERIIQGAGGEIGFDGFYDPRPGQSGGMVADRVFINERTNDIQGINFSKNGEFCCSYTGMNYQDIKDSNRRDVDNKRTHSDSASERGLFSSGETSKTLQAQRAQMSENHSNGMSGQRRSNTHHH